MCVCEVLALISITIEKEIIIRMLDSRDRSGGGSRGHSVLKKSVAFTPTHEIIRMNCEVSSHTEAMCETGRLTGAVSHRWGADSWKRRLS